MDEIITKIQSINSLEELDNIGSINKNNLIYAIAKSNRYDLLKDSNLRLDLSDDKTLENLVDLLLSDEDYSYDMKRNGFYFSKEELDCIFKIVNIKYQTSYKLDNFFRYFFQNKEELNEFIIDHETFFEKYIKTQYENKLSVSYTLEKCDKITELILKGNYVNLINKLENYSPDNLKLLVNIPSLDELPYYIGDDRYAKHLFELKDELEPNEFYRLLTVLKEKSIYDYKSRDNENSLFTNLVNENIDYLVDLVSKTNTLPKCLVESATFRDACIKRNRIDLAVQCVMPKDIINNEELLTAYCKELNIEPKEFYERYKWLLNYYEKNNNVFNTVISTSLKENIFNLNKEHYERFINDVEVQMYLSKLNDKELLVLSKILDNYNYKDYDITLMIVNILKNISSYQELINSLEIENLKEEDLKLLISVIQLPNNEFQIINLDSLRNYKNKKQEYLENNINKDNLLKLLFNINLKEAKYIESKYCFDNDNNNVLELLKNSELPKQIYDYLLLINKILSCNNNEELLDIYNSLKDKIIYNNEIPLEVYLRSEYTKLYSNSLYRVEEKNNVYGPKDNITNEITFNGKKVQICIPREKFNFFVHCVGSCSVAEDVSDKNYRNDWLDRPQMKDHFVACSYINEKGIYSIRSQGSIIFGFDSLEGGAILGMGNTDIDSIGRYANSYAGSRELQEGNGERARFFTPSEILKTIHKGYNEIVVERRNNDKEKNNLLKRKPDYIIMMTDSIEDDNLNYLENLYSTKLSFISEEDKKEIEKIGDTRKLKQFLVKYKPIIVEHAEQNEITPKEMVTIYVDLIMKAKYFEDCLKASSEFDIPLVIVDKTYYFNKMLADSGKYTTEEMLKISEFYKKADEYKKKELYNLVAQGKDITSIMNPKPTNNFRIAF